MKRKIIALCILCTSFLGWTPASAGTTTGSYNLATATITTPDTAAPNTEFSVSVDGTLLSADGFDGYAYQLYENAEWAYTDSHLVSISTGILVDADGFGLGPVFTQDYAFNKPAGVYKYTFIFGDRRGGHDWYDVAVDAFVTVAPSEVEATLDSKPDTLNTRSKGVWVTAYIEIPTANVSDIQVASVTLVTEAGTIIAVDQDGPTSIGDYDGDGVSDLMLKFSRPALISGLGPTNDVTSATLRVRGYLADGTLFEGVDTIGLH